MSVGVQIKKMEDLFSTVAVQIQPSLKTDKVFMTFIILTNSRLFTEKKLSYLLCGQKVAKNRGVASLPYFNGEW
ncbi:MAG: hypothetical protein LAT67_09435 [Balneolales bacterium]|nr:hypothetical protein [Balneolales bacterium]